MITRGLTSATLASLLGIALASCSEKADSTDTAAAPAAVAPSTLKPNPPPILNTATARFQLVKEMASIVEGAKVTDTTAGGFQIMPSTTQAGYQAGATLPTDQVDHIVVRYEIGQASDSSVIGILAGDGSHWLTSATVGAGGASSGELTTAVAEKEVRLVVEAKNGAKPFILEKLEWAAFCVKPSSAPDVAPVTEQCYPKLPPIFAIEGAKFVPSTLSAWAPDAKVATETEGAVTITPSPTTTGYQASIDIPEGKAAAVAVDFELEDSSGAGNIGILRGDASAWIKAVSFGPGQPKSGQILGVVEGGGVKLVVESAAGIAPIRFKKLELALLCETKPAQGPVPATVSACP